MGRRFLAWLLPLLVALPLSARPKVALVLGGGGAKGFAEIAVIEAVERYGIPVDMVLGTSMGALIGAMYSAGYTPKEIDAFASSNDFMSVVLEPASERPFPMPEAFAPRKDNVISLGFSQKRIGSTPGLLGDSRLLDLLNRMYGRQDGVVDFDDLPIPFRAVATNAVTGQRIVYDHGSLVDAVRSSISLPVIFAPYPQPDGSLAMDGGLVDNVPIDLARELGADYVIAVDVNGHQMLGEAEIQSVTDAALQVATLVTQSPAVRQYDGADILVLPHVEGYGTMAFGDYEEIVAEGRKECEVLAPRFEALARELEAQGALASYDPERIGAYQLVEPRVVSDVLIEDRSTIVQRQRLKKQDFASFTGKVFDEKQRVRLSRYLERLRSTYRFASLSYDLQDLPDGTTQLVIRTSSYAIPQHRFTIGGIPEAGVSNNGPEQATWAALNLRTQFDFTQMGPVEHLKFWYEQGQSGDMGVSVTLPFVSMNSHIFGFEGSAVWSMGSFELGSNLDYGDRRAALDMGVLGDLSFLYDYADLFNLRIGNQFRWCDIHHGESSFWMSRAYASVVVDTMHKSSLIQSGFRADVRYQAEWKDGTEYGYSLQALLRQDIEIRSEREMLGYQLEFHWLRLSEGLNQSYVDIGGVNGLPGYSYATLRQDVAGGCMRYRIRVATVLGCPIYVLAKVGALVFDDQDPFEGQFAIGHFFHGDLFWDIGAGAGVAVTTPIGSVFAGGGFAAHSCNYDVMVGVII